MRSAAKAAEQARIAADPMIPHERLIWASPGSKIPALELEDGRLLCGSSVIALWADGLGGGPRPSMVATQFRDDARPLY